MTITLMTWIRKAGDFLFGFDFFISYAHDDGIHYPQKLADILQTKGFRVFLDSRVYVAGDDLSSATYRRIKMSKYLLLLVRPEAMNSKWVLIELQRCMAVNGRTIAININDTLENTPDDNALKQLLEDKIYISEALDNVDAEPTENAINSIAQSFKSTRQDTIRLRAIIAASVTLLAIAAFAGWQYMESRKQVLKTQEQTALRFVANAERQMFQNPQESLILAAQGASASQSKNAIQASTNTAGAALQVIRQRQEIQQDPNWGSNLFQSYIAGAWFEADLRARYNKGGELLLLSTERGVSGNNPPGDAFLLDTKSLSIKMLDIGLAWGTKTQGVGIITTLTARPNVESATIPFVCSAHPNATGRLQIGKGEPVARVVARDDDRQHWFQTHTNKAHAYIDLPPDGQVTFEVESGQHGLTFLDKDHALSLLDINDSKNTFETKPDIRTRRRTKRRLEFVGFGTSGKKIYLSRQYNVEVYSINGGFLKEFKTGGGCTKYPISYVTGVMDDQLIVYGDTDGGVYTLNYTTGDCQSLGRRPGRILIKFDLNLSGQYGVLVFRDRTASLWEISPKNSRKNLLKLPNKTILSAWFNPRIENQLLTSGEDGLVTLWEIREGTLHQVHVYQHADEPIEFSMFSDDGQSIITVNSSKKVTIWDTTTGKEIGSIKNRSLEN